MNNLTEAIITIAMAIVGVATLSVILSKNANTANVIQAGASGFGNSLGVAMSGVTGAQYDINLGYPSASMFG